MKRRRGEKGFAKKKPFRLPCYHKRANEKRQHAAYFYRPPLPAGTVTPPRLRRSNTVFPIPTTTAGAARHLAGSGCQRGRTAGHTINAHLSLLWRQQAARAPGASPTRQWARREQCHDMPDGSLLCQAGWWVPGRKHLLWKASSGLRLGWPIAAANTAVLFCSFMACYTFASPARHSLAAPADEISLPSTNLSISLLSQ